MRIGAMWKNKKDDGTVFYSCVMENPLFPNGKINFAIFPNTEKQSDNSPDGHIVWNSKQQNNQMSDDDIPM